MGVKEIVTSAAGAVLGLGLNAAVAGTEPPQNIDGCSALTQKQQLASKICAPYAKTAFKKAATPEDRCELSLDKHGELQAKGFVGNNPLFMGSEFTTHSEPGRRSAAGTLRSTFAIYNVPDHPTEMTGNVRATHNRKLGQEYMTTLDYKENGATITKSNNPADPGMVCTFTEPMTDEKKTLPVTTKVWPAPQPNKP